MYTKQKRWDNRNLRGRLLTPLVRADYHTALCFYLLIDISYHEDLKFSIIP